MYLLAYYWHKLTVSPNFLEINNLHSSSLYNKIFIQKVTFMFVVKYILRSTQDWVT